MSLTKGSYFFYLIYIIFRDKIEQREGSWFLWYNDKSADNF